MKIKESPALLDNAMTYQQYLEHLRRELEHPANGDPKGQSRKEKIRDNLFYMEQTYNGTVVWDRIKNALAIAPPTTWLVLTEGWSTDAARTTPLFQRIAEESNGKVTVRFVLRDRNLGLMDRYLTEGTRSIPKLIVLDHDLNELATWGPRPAVLQAEVKKWRPLWGLEKAELERRLAHWYDGDDTDSAQEEMVPLIESYA